MEEESKKQTPWHEALERAFASNDKVQFDNLIAQCNIEHENVIAHCKNLMNYSELSVKQSVEFQQKSNDAYLAERDRREQQRMEHDDERFKHYMENNRYTMNYLYWPEHAVDTYAMVATVIATLKAAGMYVEPANAEEQK